MVSKTDKADTIIGKDEKDQSGLDDRIKTLPEEIDNEEKGITGDIQEVDLDKNSIDECKRIIASTKDLHPELVDLEINIDSIARIVAYIKREDRKWENANEHKRREIASYKDQRKKLLKRNKNLNRERFLKSVSQNVTRKIIGQNEAEKAKRSITKRRPYRIPELLYLKNILSEKTDRPYRYMAAIVNLFGLHTENIQTCTTCKYNEFNDQDERQCRRKMIFRCPLHKPTRDSLHQMLSQK